MKNTFLQRFFPAAPLLIAGAALLVPLTLSTPCLAADAGTEQPASLLSGDSLLLAADSSLPVIPKVPDRSKRPPRRPASLDESGPEAMPAEPMVTPEAAPRRTTAAPAVVREVPMPSSQEAEKPVWMTTVPPVDGAPKAATAPKAAPKPVIAAPTPAPEPEFAAPAPRPERAATAPRRGSESALIGDRSPAASYPVMTLPTSGQPEAALGDSESSGIPLGVPGSTEPVELEAIRPHVGTYDRVWSSAATPVKPRVSVDEMTAPGPMPAEDPLKYPKAPTKLPPERISAPTQWEAGYESPPPFRPRY